jgi:DNA-binding response OmpR family regulator
MGGPATRLSILLIDDERDFSSTLAMRLNLRGFQAGAVFDGETGLETLAREHFDVVLLDLHLPGLSGAETLRRIRARRPELPVILLTGHACVEEDIERQVTACLTKPLDLEELLHILGRLGGGNA